MPIPFKQVLSAISTPGGATVQPSDYYRSLYDYMQLVPDGGLIVEIGVWKGFSTVVMGAAIHGTRSRIIAIDPILSCHMVLDSSTGQIYESSYEEVHAKIVGLGLNEYITLIPDRSENVLARWDGRLIDFLYVDGAHDYGSVRKDCGWLKYVNPHKGLAAFDDWQATRDVSRAVIDATSLLAGWSALHINGAPPPDKENEDDPDILWDVTLLQKNIYGTE